MIVQDFEKPLVSVITICLNSAQVIEKTIQSVLNQTYQNIEYIIIDGASKDNTVAIAKSYKEAFEKEHNSMLIVSEPDNGIYDAMNKGIRNASGELIGIINSGDWYEPIAVETAVKKMPYDLFYADINLIKNDGSVIVKHSCLDRFPSSRNWNHPSMFAPRKTYESIGTYRCEDIYDDFDFYLRCRRKKTDIVIENTILANFCTGGESNTKSFSKMIKRMRTRYNCYRNNGYSFLSIFECVAMEVAKVILS